MDETPVFRIFGLGGAGGRIADAVSSRTGGRLSGFAVDTDSAALGSLECCRRLLVGQSRFSGLGSGGDVSAAHVSAQEARAALARELEDVCAAVVVAGLGGGTGSGALPVLLRLADERNVPTLVVAVSPFGMEGTERVRAAGAALRACEGLGTARILLSNDDLAPPSRETTLEEAFARATDVAAAALSLLWKMTALRGYVNLSPADVVQLLRNGRGTVDFGWAVARGPQRFSEAVDALWNQPGLGLAPKTAGAKAALACVLGGPDLRLVEVGDAAAAVSAMLPFGTPVSLATVVDPDAAGSFELALLLFRHWSEPGAVADPAAAPTAGRFVRTPATVVDGENLDQPTYERRRIHIDAD